MLVRRTYARNIPPPRVNKRPRELYSCPARTNSVVGDFHLPFLSEHDRQNPNLLRAVVREEQLRANLQRYSRTTASYKAKRPELLRPQDTGVCCLLTQYRTSTKPLSSGRLDVSHLYCSCDLAELRELLARSEKPEQLSSAAKEGSGRQRAQIASKTSSAAEQATGISYREICCPSETHSIDGRTDSKASANAVR